ncbi:uncharacterized protein N7500_007157 [Penicillium coprophilum]|uniref:uncharacterized protein n=1 Tax=Penicillium coprophilum TaxID=36646 RepID=UPI00239C6355|nr:uncharacterized protein N7500_007157 [Penicillium coprophilum]KAJ5165327.1 hypothetical protein N7500_007157 [Penicillium coprophilum]
MASNESIDNLTGILKGLVIGASGTIPGYQHVNRAQQLQDCQIVDMDWLLTKIKEHVPESVQKEILKEKHEDIKAKGKKRERGPSLGDDEGTSAKKTKDEEQINLENLIELVDEKYPDRSATLSVWQDDTGLIWDATLVRAYKRKSVEVVRIQLLVDRKLEIFHTWDLQCRFGSSKESKSIGDVGTFESAKDTFEEKFKLLSGLAWEDRHHVPTSKGWIFLELHHREAPIFTSEITTLPASVENVLSIIFTTGTFKTYLGLLNHHGRSIALTNKVDKKKLLISIAILGKLMELTNPGMALDKHSIIKRRLCHIYESLILTNLPLSGTNDTVRQELESLELLLKLYDASEILERESRSELIGVFRLERPGEAERFAQWEKANLADIGDRRLLWHGSMSSNFAGILTQGLRGDGIVSTDGKHFVSGVFFADISTKSAGYCRLKGEALMLLCEVELGKSAALSRHVIGGTVHKAWRDAEYIHPDFKGSKVPDVHAGTVTASHARSFYHSEYVANSPAQIRQRYLFHVKIV